MFRMNNYYSGHYNAGQSFRSSGDTTLKHFDGDSSKLNNAELPSRPEPPKTPFMCFARYKEEEMARNRQTGDIKVNVVLNFYLSKKTNCIS
jgi:hypothetical protein